MSINILLNNTSGEEWDIVYSEAPFQLQIIRNEDYIAQKAKQILLTSRDEVFTDKDYGIPWIDEILGQKNPDLGNIRRILLSTLEVNQTLLDLGVTNVSIGNISVDPLTRNMSISNLSITTTTSDRVEIGRVLI